MKARKQGIKAIYTFNGEQIECTVYQQYSNGYYLLNINETPKVVHSTYVTEL